MPNHNPQEHFSEAQVAVITDLFHAEINKMLIKIIGTNVIIVAMGIMAVGAGWYRLGHVEDAVQDITGAVYQSLPTKEYVDGGDRLLQQQVSANTEYLKRIENKVDLIIDKI